MRNLCKLLTICIILISSCKEDLDDKLKINDLEYFEMQGLNVMLFSDFYPEGHQGGVTIIQNGVRIAANGDVRLEPVPGQWQPIPKVGERIVDSINNELQMTLSFPDSSRDGKGFNPIFYPDLYFKYKIRVQPLGKDFKVIVDLEKPLPEEWIGKVGFNFELFPGTYFEKSFIMDDKRGIFPRQLNGGMEYDEDGRAQAYPLAEGNKLTVAPENQEIQLIFESENTLQLLDGRAQHNNGWFVVRSAVLYGATKNAIEWTIRTNPIPGWKYEPVIHVSQVGYHPKQKKIAVLEFDKQEKEFLSSIKVEKFNSDGESEIVLSKEADNWGSFLRYNYAQLDFSEITEEGLYQITYGDVKSNIFSIDNEVYNRHVWQTTLEYFLPVQMCHMRINDRYRVWHGLCHEDDALMAPTDTNHFDGYLQGSSTLTKYKPLEPVPGLNVGGWHDAGDYDLRVESQIGTVHILSLAQEEFNVDYDVTSIDQSKKIVEMHQPDGVPDILQQIEHGLLTVLGGYDNLGRLYRGIICPTLRQYVLLGDGSTMTDNRVYSPALKDGEKRGARSGTFDDRWVFTEENPSRELQVVAGLAASSRVMKEYNSQLAEKSLRVAKEIYSLNANSTQKRVIGRKIEALAELYLTTQDEEYENALYELLPEIKENIERLGWVLGRVMPLLDNESFVSEVNQAVKELKEKIDKERLENPFGVPYRPHIWGAGWGIQRFGFTQYFFHTGWPDIFDAEYMHNALHFVLGCHPGQNTASFASGVGANSLLVAYGVNRAEWSYIPGGVGSGTNLVRPDFPELKEWPYFWQQTEYVMGGGGSNFMFLALAADHLLNE